ncbi:hypothetical protein LWI29_000819 [Acer saccharum]|uniref:Uncharacterized protein n=1 Tax=Acer saccharum TaxID=4024 RepID=A0AA39RFQ8_ACESA|nr:hypothetical protein LWI29_000819 [Acer saccharum]
MEAFWLSVYESFRGYGPVNSTWRDQLWKILCKFMGHFSSMDHRKLVSRYAREIFVGHFAGVDQRNFGSSSLREDFAGDFAGDFASGSPPPLFRGGGLQPPLTDFAVAVTSAMTTTEDEDKGSGCARNKYTITNSPGANCYHFKVFFFSFFCPSRDRNQHEKSLKFETITEFLTVCGFIIVHGLGLALFFNKLPGFFSRKEE